MIVNWETLKAAFQGYRALFKAEMLKTTFEWTKIAMLVESAGESEYYNWLGSFPGMREWIGDKDLAQLSASRFQIVNKDWEATLEVDRNELEDDKLNMVRPRIAQLPYSAKMHMDQLIFELLKNGFAATCYDGQYFFDTDHSEGESGTQSNKGTTAFSEAAVKTTLAAGMKIKNDKGQYMGIVYDTIVVPPDLYFDALAVAKSPQLIITGSTDLKIPGINVLAELRLQVIANPFLTDTNDWMMLQTKAPMKPLIMQIRKAPDFVEQVKPESDAVFMRKKFKFGLEGRYNAGYGLWQLAYGHAVS